MLLEIAFLLGRTSFNEKVDFTLDEIEYRKQASYISCRIVEI